MDKLTLTQVLLRSFFLQSVWNYKGLQNMGFAFAMLPALKKLYGQNKDKLRSAVSRYMEPFNTHPYMAPAISGVLINLEEAGPAQDWSDDKIDDLKRSIMSGFAALGDSFFWNTIRPLASTMGLLAVFASGWLGLIVLLIVFNLISFFARFYGLWAGYKRGIRIIYLVESYELPKLVLRLRVVICGLLGFLATVITVFNAPQTWTDTFSPVFLILVCPLVVLFAVMIKKGITVEFLLYSLTLFSIVGYSLIFGF